MKIIHTPPRFIPAGEGIANYVYCLCRELMKSGHKVKVICANNPIVKNNLVDGIPVDRLVSAINISNTPITPWFPFRLLKESFDIIHTHIPHPWGADWSGFSSLMRNKPLIITYHNEITGKGFYSYVAQSYNAIF